MISRQNLKVQVAEHIRAMIFSGEVRPGSRVDQDLIAEQVGVSRLPVREALIMMEGEGLITNQVRRGYFIANLTPEDLHDHFYIFGLLAGLAAERAAAKMMPEELDRLREILAQSADTEDPRALNRLNEEFHAIINRNAGSRRLRVALGVLADSMPRSFFELNPGREKLARAEHAEIIDALARRDGDAARSLMLTHLRDSGDFVVEALRERGFWDTDT